MDRKRELGVLLVLLGVALGLGLHTVWLVYCYAAPAPFSDMYPIWFRLAEHGFRWSDLLVPHNEHVIAIPRLFYRADVSLAHGTEAFLIAVSVLLAVAVPLAESVVGGREFFARRRDALAYSALVFVCYFNGTHLTSLAAGFMIPHLIVALSVLLSTYGFACLAAGENRSWAALGAVSAFFAATAVLTVGNGLVSLMAAVAVGVAFRLRWKAVFFFTAMLGLGLVFQLLVNPPAGHRLEVFWQSRPACARFYLSFLGGPFLRCVSWPSPSVFWRPQRELAVGLGAVFLVAALALLARATFSRRRASVFVVFHSVLVVYVLASGVLLTASRLNVDPYYGTEPKYAAMSLLGWIGVFSLGLESAAGLFPLPISWRPAAWAAGLAALLAFVLPAHFREQRVLHGWNGLVWESEAGQVAGVFDPETLTAFDFQREQAFRLSQEFLKPRRLSMFHRYRFTMGDRLADHFAVVPAGNGLGSFDNCLKLAGPNGGFRVDGWAWNTARGAPVRDVLLCDPEGRIAGLAHTTRERPDVVGVHPQIQVLCGWFGYLRPVAPGTIVSAYAVLDGSHACRFGEFRAGKR